MKVSSGTLGPAAKVPVSRVVMNSNTEQLHVDEAQATTDVLIDTTLVLCVTHKKIPLEVQRCVIDHLPATPLLTCIPPVLRGLPAQPNQIKITRGIDCPLESGMRTYQLSLGPS